MFFEALVPLEDLRALIAEALPLTVRLDDTGGLHSLALSELSEISLVPERGVRLVCKARLRWPVLGIDAPLTVNALRVLLVPEVKPSPGGEILTFGITLEHADISGVPSLLDDAIARGVNEKLADIPLSWDFSKTFAQVVPLPILLEELDALRLRAAWGKVKVSEEALVFALCLHTTLDRRGEAAVDLAPPALDAATPPTRTDPEHALQAHASPVAVSLAAAALFGLAAGAAFFGLRKVASRW
jgi:hypothetical protein